MPEPVPTKAGKVLRLAAISSPPLPGLAWGVLKSKTNCLSSGRRAKRSTAVSARKSLAVRLKPESSVRAVTGTGPVGMARTAALLARMVRAAAVKCILDVWSLMITDSILCDLAENCCFKKKLKKDSGNKEIQRQIGKDEKEIEI